MKIVRKIHVNLTSSLVCDGPKCWSSDSVDDGGAREKVIGQITVHPLGRSKVW